MRTKQTNEKQMKEHVAWLMCAQKKRKAFRSQHCTYDYDIYPIASACSHRSFKFQSDFPAALSSRVTSCREIVSFQMLSETGVMESIWMEAPRKSTHGTHVYTHMIPPRQFSVRCDIWPQELVNSPAYQCFCGSGVLFVYTVASIPDTLGGFVW